MVRNPGRGSPVLGARVQWIVERVIHIVRHEGLGSLGRRIKGLATRCYREWNSGWPLSGMSLAQQYRIWRARHPEDADPPPLNSTGPSSVPLISIIVSTVGCPVGLLKGTLESIAQQGYANWELVLVGEPSQTTAIRSLFEVIGVGETHTVHVLEAEAHGFHSMLRGAQTSSGEFVWFVKCGDLLAHHALASAVHVLNEERDADLLYCDEDRSLPDGSDSIPFFKPSWSPELLLSTNYLSYSTVFRRALLSGIIHANERGHNLSLYDCLLWASEKTTHIIHLSSVLYHSREGSNPQVQNEAGQVLGASAEKSALERALHRRGIEGKVEETAPGYFRIRYRLDQQPLVSIIIPTRDRISLLARCVDSIEQHTTYEPYEILILDNGSVSVEAREYFEMIGKRWQVLSCPGPFNFSAINNQGAGQAKGEYLLFLNDDTEVMTPDWLTIMIEQGARPGVGVVGAKLLYPNGRIQHGGVVLGVGSVAGHAFRHIPDQEWSYHGFAHVTRNCSAVTAACLLVSRALFMQVRGFDVALPVEYNDVDLCLRIAREGYRIVYAPDAVLYHYESATRKGSRCRTDEERAQKIWGELIRAGDPYYHASLTRDREDWSLRL